jgi:hypothetical protein
MGDWRLLGAEIWNFKSPSSTMVPRSSIMIQLEEGFSTHAMGQITTVLSSRG